VYRENSSSIIGIFKEPDLSLTNINLSPQPLIVILEGIEKPETLVQSFALVML
jgi:hypothetical protein